MQGAGHPGLYTSMSPLWSRPGFSHTLNTPWSYKGGDAEAWGSLVTPVLRGTHLSLCWAPQRHSWRRDPRRSPVVSESAHSKGLLDGGGGAFSREVRGQLDAREQTAPTPARGRGGSGAAGRQELGSTGLDLRRDSSGKRLCVASGGQTPHPGLGTGGRSAGEPVHPRPRQEERCMRNF